MFLRFKDPENIDFKISDIVEHVEFTPHSTFNDKTPRRTFANKCNERTNLRLPASRNDEITWSSIVWGWFDVPMKISFRECLKIPPIKISSNISFQAPLNICGNHTFSFNQTVLRKAKAT